MSIRITSDDHKVAMYDSVTGLAFGPVFDSATEASGFVDYVNEKYEEDARKIEPGTLAGMAEQYLELNK